MQDAKSLNYKAYAVAQANYPLAISYKLANKIPLGLYVDRAGLKINFS